MNKRAAERAFEKEVFKSMKEGIETGGDLTGIMREAFEKAGFDFSSREAIDRFEKRLEPEYHKFQQKEIELTNQYKALLLESGATELELQWGNFSQIRPNPLQARKLEKIGRKIDDARMEALPLLSLIAALNEARKALES